jgi:hypothetical protein
MRIPRRLSLRRFWLKSRKYKLDSSHAPAWEPIPGRSAFKCRRSLGTIKNENFPQLAVEELRRLGHDVLTVLEAGRANQFISNTQAH